MTLAHVSAARQARLRRICPVCSTLLRSDAKHDPSAASTLDVHWVLYDRVLDVTPDTVDDPERDRLLLSKGHGPASYYAVLAAKGFISVGRAGRLRALRLCARAPSRRRADRRASRSRAARSVTGCPSPSAGRSRCGRTGRTGPRVFCVLGDGELAEGSNHEAIALAGPSRPRRLTAIVVDNFSATYGWPDGIADALRGRGLDDRERSTRATTTRSSGPSPPADPGRPHAVVALVEA